MLENALPQEGLNLAEKLLGGGVTAQVPDTEKKKFLFLKKQESALEVFSRT